MKIIKVILLIAIFGFLIWCNFPENYPLKFTFSGKKYDLKLNPPNINFTLGGTKIQKDFKTKLGLDLKGGSHLLFDVDTSKVKPDDLKDALNSARDIIERRVNLFGVSEPVVQTVKYGNNYRISVDLPGIDDVSQAVNLIGQTAQLSFREQGGDIDPKVATNTPLFLLLNKDTGLGGTDVKKASVVYNPQNGKPEVQLTFSPEGDKKFADITRRNIGKPVGIFIDYFPISTPVVQQEITGGNAVITGNFTADQAKQLAIAINSGTLPLPVKLVEQRNIGPSLGATEVHKSILAGSVGLAMVALFMVMYYGGLGMIAVMALLIYGLITFAVFRAIPIVLTLPGVAGFILSIGMAVDSNILIFERIKEERRKGRDMDVAISIGFNRAIDAIKDANITTLLVAFILFNPLNWDFLPQFGLVRGFALTLAIGVIASLFTGIVITKRIINLFYRKRKVKKDLKKKPVISKVTES